MGNQANTDERYLRPVHCSHESTVANNQIDGNELQTLRQIASLGGINGTVNIATRDFGQKFGITQQTAYRRIKKLQMKNLILVKVTKKGLNLVTLPKGIEALRCEYVEYNKIFNDTMNRYILKGTVISGVGEGKYYISIPYYQQMITKLCGFIPYNGTLNVKLDALSLHIRNQLEAFEWKIIPGFEDEHRQFGESRCLLCKIKEYPCAIIVPMRTHHPSEIIEIISPVRLRDVMSLTDGMSIELYIDQ